MRESNNPSNSEQLLLSYLLSNNGLLLPAHLVREEWIFVAEKNSFDHESQLPIAGKQFVIHQLQAMRTMSKLSLLTLLFMAIISPPSVGSFTFRTTQSSNGPGFGSRMSPSALSQSINEPFCAEAFTTAASCDEKEKDALSAENNTHPWSVHVRRLSKNETNNSGDQQAVQGKNGVIHDVTSARGWMENIEQNEGGVYGVGAYTVIRCDFSDLHETVESMDESQCHWRIWGLDFHLDRLCSSFSMMMEKRDKTSMAALPQGLLQEMQQETKDVMKALIKEAEGSLLTNGLSTTSMRNNKLGTSLGTNRNAKSTIEESNNLRTLMLTILWTPPNKPYRKPIIRGHASFTSAGNSKDPMPPPIAVCLAVPTVLSSAALDLLPKRHVSDKLDAINKVGPKAKMSSWCRIRRPLEDPTRFKVPGSGVREVLLVRMKNALLNEPPTTDKEDSGVEFLTSLELLEGLTSNLFVIYKDGTVRTAPSSAVLPGYARYLINNVLKEKKYQNFEETCNHLEGLVLDADHPPTVEDALQGRWSEVFVTSAIRLITPVDQVFIPSIEGVDSIDVSGNGNSLNGFTTLWQAESPLALRLTEKVRSAVYETGINESVPLEMLA